MISEMLDSLKDGTNLTRSKLIEKLDLPHISSSGISCGISKLTELNKKANIVKRMTSNYKSNFNTEFKRDAIVNTRSPREYNTVYLNRFVKDLVKELPKTTVKRNLS